VDISFEDDVTVILLLVNNMHALKNAAFDLNLEVPTTA
jgi:hypothetical protein